ncbi:hypothetical protein NA8A_11570 [Nitratireductor indicus C115]|uniref:ANTAR domain-containing protein n=1 Tax=Nitratireductor indicus C115 TaxID=1231190 RepID=K2NS79_9HYPH|nr:ANTAR domain-containing protein [Nitratireductor indicus]EKF42185.1 hypothetical protein NA8A_11570 [Nitratireductor indicus C115]SFQ61294.1 Two-component response regulator, AmiR/NasT family, consists of REC and RNA-binding antiterminator (ANTAR) domains [Nitratireductor indicus]
MARYDHAAGKRGPSHKTAASAGQSNIQAQQKAFWDLDVAIIARRDDEGERLMRELQRLRCNVRHIWPMPPQIPVQFDLVFCTLTEDLPQRIPWIPGEPEAALVVIDCGTGELDLQLIHNCAAHGVLHYPATPRTTQTCVALARGHFLYEKRLRGRIDKLDENLRTMRSVERAKSLLIRMKDVTEEEAYNYLRRQAMERRVTIGAVANAIIDSHELLS